MYLTANKGSIDFVCVSNTMVQPRNAEFYFYFMFS